MIDRGFDDVTRSLALSLSQGCLCLLLSAAHRQERHSSVCTMTRSKGHSKSKARSRLLRQRAAATTTTATSSSHTKSVASLNAALREAVRLAVAIQRSLLSWLLTRSREIIYRTHRPCASWRSSEADYCAAACACELGPCCWACGNPTHVCLCREAPCSLARSRTDSLRACSSSCWIHRRFVSNTRTRTRWRAMSSDRAGATTRAITDIRYASRRLDGVYCSLECAAASDMMMVMRHSNPRLSIVLRSISPRSWSNIAHSYRCWSMACWRATTTSTTFKATTTLLRSFYWYRMVIHASCNRSLVMLAA